VSLISCNFIRTLAVGNIINVISYNALTNFPKVNTIKSYK